MCDPVSIGASLLMAAGTASQMAGQSQAAHAQRNTALGEVQSQQQQQMALIADQKQAAADQLATQQAGRAPAVAAANNEVQGYSAPAIASNIAEGTARRDAALQAVSGPQTGYAVGTTNQAVKDYQDKIRAGHTAFGQQQGTARAAMGGWADALRVAGDNAQRGGEQIAVQNNLTQGTLAQKRAATASRESAMQAASAGQAATLPARMGAAAQQGAGARQIGDLGAGLGQIGMTTRGSGPGAGTAAWLTGNPSTRWTSIFGANGGAKSADFLASG